MHFHDIFGKYFSSYKLCFKFLNFSIFKILPIFRDISMNSFLCKHKIEFFRKMHDGILMFTLDKMYIR